MSNPLNIFITGIPGTGKSTIAELLAKRLNYTHVTEDLSNPYFKENNPLKITNWFTAQLEYIDTNSVVDYYPTASKYIYLDKSDRESANTFPLLQEELVIALVAPLTVIRDRILSRNREGLIDIELKQHELRYYKYQEFLTEHRGQYLEIDATPKVDIVLENIINSL